MTGTASADTAGEIAAQLEYWPAKCTELEKSGTRNDASRCWWFAAEELNRYATAGHPLSDDLEEIRSDWLWRGARLTLHVLEPKPSESPVIATTPVTPPEEKLDQPRKKKAAAPTASKKKAAASTANKKKAVTAAVSTKKVTKTAQAVRKASRKKALETASARSRDEAALPLVPKIERTTNVACPPAKPCIGRRSPTALLR